MYLVEEPQDEDGESALQQQLRQQQYAKDANCAVFFTLEIFFGAGRAHGGGLEGEVVFGVRGGTIGVVTWAR